MNYSPELKEAMLRRMLPPNNESITKIAKEEGLSEQTLRNWRDKARKEGYAAPGKDAAPDDWSTQDKFLIVVETASLNETELVYRHEAICRIIPIKDRDRVMKVLSVRPLNETAS